MGKTHMVHGFDGSTRPLARVQNHQGHRRAHEPHMTQRREQSKEKAITAHTSNESTHITTAWTRSRTLGIHIGVSRLAQKGPVWGFEVFVCRAPFLLLLLVCLFGHFKPLLQSVLGGRRTLHSHSAAGRGEKNMLK
jgi:hypothetical protein